LVAVEQAKDEFTSFGMYTHPNGEKEWRRCKIIGNDIKKKEYDQLYNIVF